MTSVFHAGHQRQSSQVQHLIPRSFEDPEAGGSSSSPSPYETDLVQCSIPCPATPIRTNPSVLSSCDSYYGLPGSFTENETRNVCKNPYLRANVRVIVGSLMLTFVGAGLLLFGLLVMLVPNEIDIHGWIFLVVGVLFFIPGTYHITFILCVLCGRPGYSFDNLPTFNRPPI